MAAAAAPSHRMHSLHGPFGGASSRLTRSSFTMSPAQASWDRIPNVCAPRRHQQTYELAPAPRTTLASLSSSSGASSSGPVSPGVGVGMRSSAAGSRPRRTTMSAGSYGSPVPTRRAPPPPPVSVPAERTASALATSLAVAPALPDPIPVLHSEDPFADAEDDLTPFPPTKSISSRTRVSVPSTMQIQRSSPPSSPPGLSSFSVPSAKDMRGRMVANVLLNRGSGRPLGVYLRRRLSGEGTTYVKSGLSQLVAVAA